MVCAVCVLCVADLPRLDLSSLDSTTASFSRLLTHFNSSPTSPAALIDAQHSLPSLGHNLMSALTVGFFRYHRSHASPAKNKKAGAQKYVCFVWGVFVFFFFCLFFFLFFFCLCLCVLCVCQRLLLCERLIFCLSVCCAHTPARLVTPDRSRVRAVAAAARTWRRWWR